MKLRLEGYKFAGQGSVMGTVSLIDEAGDAIYQDSVNLSNANQRRRFAKGLGERFPDLKGKDIEAQLLQLLWEVPREEPTEGKGPQVSQADLLVQITLGDDVILFHDQFGDAYARVDKGGHQEIWRCRGKAFKEWLASRFWTLRNKTPNTDAVNSALTVIEGKAKFEGEKFELFNRVGWHDGAIYYDLSNEKWSAVRITPEDWRVVPSPILFRRFPHQAPQVMPERGSSLDELLPFVNLDDDASWLLFQAHLVSCLVPDIPHPCPHPMGP